MKTPDLTLLTKFLSNCSTDLTLIWRLLHLLLFWQLLLRHLPFFFDKLLWHLPFFFYKFLRHLPFFLISSSGIYLSNHTSINGEKPWGDTSLHARHQQVLRLSRKAGCAPAEFVNKICFCLLFQQHKGIEMDPMSTIGLFRQVVGIIGAALAYKQLHQILMLSFDAFAFVKPLSKENNAMHITSKPEGMAPDCMKADACTEEGRGAIEEQPTSSSGQRQSVA